VTRQGKWILVRLSADAGLGIHLGMTGDLVLTRDGEPPRFSRAALVLDDGARVHFTDARRFGRLLAVSRFEALLKLPALASQGPDALAVGLGELRERLRSSRAVKVALMDQAVLAGLGNVYAGDALFVARIHPARPARAVAGNAALARRLHAAIRAVLGKGLARYEAGSPREEGSGELYPGSIYGRAGKPCPRCRRPLASMRLGGRTTVYCGRCQPLR
jgi:formamidopyrimidine-DNA glycosylase